MDCGFLLIDGDVIPWMRQFLVRKIILSKFVFIEDVYLWGRATKECHENWANINSFNQWFIFSLILVTHREFGTSPIKPAVQEFSPSPRIQEQRAYEQRVQASNHLARQAKQLKQRVGYLTQQVRTTTLFILWIYIWCFMWSTNWKQFLQFCSIFSSDSINTMLPIYCCMQ